MGNYLFPRYLRNINNGLQVNIANLARQNGKYFSTPMFKIIYYVNQNTKLSCVIEMEYK